MQKSIEDQEIRIRRLTITLQEKDSYLDKLEHTIDQQNQQ